ncbi:MAG: cation:proton antiporter [Pseudonocardiaceae bacterium]
MTAAQLLRQTCGAATAGLSCGGVAAPAELPGTDVVGYVLADLALILLAARLIGGLFVRLRQPRVVGEMIAGILIGPTVLGGRLAAEATRMGDPAQAGTGLTNAIYPLQAYAFLNLLGVLALVLFTFLVGMEVPQRLLAGRGRQIVTVGLATVVAPLALGAGVATVLDEPGVWRVAELADGRAVPFTTHVLVVGAGLAATALPVIARILQGKDLIATQIGALGLGAAAVTTPLAFVVIAVATGSGRPSDVPAAIGTRLVLAAALIGVLFGVVRPLLARLLARKFRADRPLDGGLLAVLLAGALLSALAADRIGVHALTGGLLFGAAVPQRDGLGAAVIERLQQFVMVFGIPVFLAVSGLQTDLRVLRLEHLAGIALFLLALLLGKGGVGALVSRATGMTWHHAGAVGAMLSCGGLVTLVIALVAQQAGMITQPMQIAFVIAAIVTTLLTGPLLDMFTRAMRRLPP